MNIVFIGSQPIGHDCLNEIIKMKIGIKAVFTFKPDIHEKWGKSVEEIAKKHSIGKAKDVAKHYNSGVIIAGDAFVVLNNEVLGKPKDEKDAFLMLKKQSGKWISVIGGLCVLDLNENKEYFELVTTNVKIAILTDDEILSYIKTKDPMDKAGSFGMMDLGTVIVEEVQGCFSNVVGLPLPALHKIFREIGIKIFDY